VALEQEDLPYTGNEMLEVLVEAANYNAELVRLLKNYFHSGSALDFGAGIGTFALMLKDSNRQIVCLETDRAQRLVLEKRGLSNVSSLDGCDEQFDFIYTLNVLEHIEDDQGVAKELVAKLKQGAKIFIFVPAFQILYSEFDRKIGHFRRYRKSEIESLFPGLIVHESRYFDFVGFFAAFIYKFTAGSKKGIVSRNAVAFFDRFLFPLNQIFDPLFSRWAGKNILFVAQKATKRE
jgi:SAM-dependent methyltransferase